MTMFDTTQIRFNLSKKKQNIIWGLGQHKSFVIFK